MERKSQETKKQMTWLDAILKVLESSKSPMHYTKIWDNIRDKHYIKCENNCNPEITVNNYIQANKELIVQFGDRGCYILKKHLDASIKKYLELTIPPQQSVIRAFGTMWSRKKFVQNNYSLLGKLATCKKSPQIDLSKERGIYVLYDGYNIVYVGQTANPIVGRLKAHIKDAKQWDTFSWYGIDEILENGQISQEKILCMTTKTLIEAFEAAMILATNPRHNKTRGNHVRGQEYQQI